MMIKDDAENRKYVTLLSLIADNSGKFDICALIYDICTGNKKTSYDDKTNEYEYEPIHERLLDVKNISSSAYLDLKKIINYIRENYISEYENKKALVIYPKDKDCATHVSLRFDDVFIKSIIEDYYHNELA